MELQKGVGSIAALWRYPVKSMMGEELRSSFIHPGGLLGDRAYALLDSETGKVVSAKNPKRWPNMFAFQSSYIEPPTTVDNLPPVFITLPNGTVIKSNQSDANGIISESFQRPVTIETKAPLDPQLEEYWPDLAELDHQDTVTDEKMPESTFFDLAVIHLLTVATLNKLSSLYPGGRFEARRFRPNIIIDTQATEGFVENQWVGKKVLIGDEVILRITGHCPRCVMTTLPQSDLPKDTNILRTAAQHNNAHVGVYAEVIQGGTVKCDSQVVLKD